MCDGSTPESCSILPVGERKTIGKQALRMMSSAKKEASVWRHFADHPSIKGISGSQSLTHIVLSCTVALNIISIHFNVILRHVQPLKLQEIVEKRPLLAHLHVLTMALRN